jgi:hypothetical protein
MSQVMMATVIGLMVGVYQQKNHSKEMVEECRATTQQRITTRKITRMLITSTLLLTLLWAVLPDLIPRMTGQEDFIAHSYITIGPRFWQQGGIPH